MVTNSSFIHPFSSSGSFMLFNHRAKSGANLGSKQIDSSSLVWHKFFIIIELIKNRAKVNVFT